MLPLPWEGKKGKIANHVEIFIKAWTKNYIFRSIEKTINIYGCITRCKNCDAISFFSIHHGSIKFSLEYFQRFQSITFATTIVILFFFFSSFHLDATN